MGIVLTNIMSELNPSRGNMSSKLGLITIFGGSFRVTLVID